MVVFHTLFSTTRKIPFSLLQNNYWSLRPPVLAFHHRYFHYSKVVHFAWLDERMRNRPISEVRPYSIGPFQNDNERLLTVPNSLSLFRMASAPAISSLLLCGQGGAALGLFSVSAFSDFLDGWTARYFRQESVLGTILDPLADKILMTTVTLTLWYMGKFPSFLALCIIARDAGLVALSFKYRWDQFNSVKKSHLIPINNVFAAGFLANFFNPKLSFGVKVKPLMSSKINTVLQLSLVTATMSCMVFPIALEPISTHFIEPLQYVYSINKI